MTKTLIDEHLRYRHHILTPNSLTVVTTGDPIQLTSQSPRFDDAVALVRQCKWPELLELLNTAEAIKAYTRGAFTFLPSGEIIFTHTETLRKKKVEHKDTLPPVLGQRMVAFMDAGLDWEPLKNFWLRLKRNPDEHVREQAYAFLEHNHCTFLADGRLLLYKKVGGDFAAGHRDRKGNKVYWKPGTEVTMDRNECCADPNKACEAGLHTAAWGYAEGFSGTTLLEIAVDPEHIVSIPHDYSHQKLRCCRAFVQAVNEDGEWKVPTTSKKRVTKPGIGKIEDDILAKIRKGQRVTLPVSGQGYINIPAPVVRLMRFEPGDKITVTWPSTRHRCLRLGRERNVLRKDTPFFTTTTVLVNGNARVRLNTLREARIDGQKEYSVTKQPGNVLELRA